MYGDRSRCGRPRKGEGPRVPYEDLDRILVFGEVVPCEDGNGTTVYYPSYREMAERYGVSNSVIAEYAKSHNVQRRRKEAQTRIQVKAEQKLVEMRAKAIAVSKDDELRIIDTYLIGFETALAENRVRFDNAADFNTMVRLKEFVQGNADSRQEIHAALSLETLQERHRRMMRTLDTSVEERGELETSVPEERDTEKMLLHPPEPSTEDAAGEPPARFAGRFLESYQAATVLRSGREVGAGRDDAPRATVIPPEPGRSERGRACGSTAEQTAGLEETHGPPTVPDFRPEDELADTLPPPPLGPEGECE
jgi:hypothetical protein